LAQGDRRALARLGLVLSELVGLPVAEQAQRIADSIVGATVEEAERAKAITRMVVEVLDSGGNLSPADAARRFVAAYVYEIALTELGAVLREQQRSEAWSANVERQLRDSIRATVAGYPLDDTAQPRQIERLIRTALDGAREVMLARGGG
jgi:hypothetical protein